MKTGFIGLGAMGWPMAENLARAGALDVVWNRTEEKSRSFQQKTGVNPASSPAALARDCDLVITCVPADADLLQVIESMRPGLRENSIILDVSTVSVATSQQLYSDLLVFGIHFLDAPVSGGVEGAVNAALTMMVGGDEAVLNKCRPVIAAMASKITWMGPSGSGQATKAVNQIMAAGINQAVTESLAFGEAMGLDMDKVIDVIGGGAAANWFLEKRGRSMLRGEYDTGFKVALHHKDLKLCQEMIAQVSGNEKKLPVVEMTLLHYRRLLDAGFAEEDISSLYRLKKELFKESR